MCVHIYTYICRYTYIHTYPLYKCVCDLRLYPSCNLTGCRLSGAPGWQEENPRAQPSHRHQAPYLLSPLSDPTWWYRAAWQETAQSRDWTPTWDSSVETWNFHKEDRSKTRQLWFPRALAISGGFWKEFPFVLWESQHHCMHSWRFRLTTVWTSTVFVHPKSPMSGLSKAAALSTQETTLTDKVYSIFICIYYQRKRQEA